MDSYLKGWLILCCIFISSCATHLERGESLELEGKYQQAADEYALGLEKEKKSRAEDFFIASDEIQLFKRVGASGG